MKKVEKPVVVFQDGGKRIVLVPPGGNASVGAVPVWQELTATGASMACVAVVETQSEDATGSACWTRVHRESVSEWLLASLAKLAAEKLEAQS